MSLFIESCDRIINPSCYMPTDVRNMFSFFLPRLDFLKVSFLLLNTVISPQQETATKLVI